MNRIEEYLKADKITDDVYVISSNLILRFNVSLSKTANSKRYHFHNEYEYDAAHLQTGNSLVTVKRSFDYYLSIENMKKDENGNKLFVRIGVQEFLRLRQALERVVAWFTNKDYDRLFMTSKGKLIVTSPAPYEEITALPMQKSICITPVVIEYGVANADRCPGVRMAFGNECYADINLEKLMGLYYTLSCFNMYQSAQLMLNYIGRPEFGVNRIYMNSSTPNNYTKYNNDEVEYEGATGVNRVIPSSRFKTNIETLED